MQSRPFVLVVDDHPVFRHGLIALLTTRLPRYAFDGVGTLHEARARIDDRVELVLADYRLPDGDGLSWLASVGDAHPSVARVLVSGVDDPSLVRRSKELGLVGLLPKTLGTDVLIDAIERILGGRTFFPTRAEAPEAFPLSGRQREILRLVAAGRATKEIAALLGIAERTVKEHVGILFQKLGAANRAKAIARAASRGLLDD